MFAPLRSTRLRQLFRSTLLLAALGIAFEAHAQRQELDLSGPWKFVRHDAALNAPFEKWASVTIPHTWNAFDGQNGKAADPDQPAGYYRGPGWYARTIEIPGNWAGRRIFLKFDAASLVAEVFLNGQRLGEHRGGFGAFVFEITGIAKPGGENVLRVKVSNAPVEDVAPLSGDFTICGGLYRPVHVFSTDATCIAPTDHGSSGVFLSQKEVTPARARVQADVMLSSREADAVEVVAELVDATGNVVQTASVPARVTPSSKKDEFTKATVPLEIAAPHLWNGRADPYLYHVRVKLRRDGRDIDEVTQPLGLRTVRITADEGFLLNGRPYPVRGVNCHRELMNKGWALTPADDEADFQLISDMGATAVRLAHYPQGDSVLSIADRLGILAWEEIPLVEQIRDTEAFRKNIEQQLTEMILQTCNHPSVAFWGIYNELNAPWANKQHPDAVPLLTAQRDLAHRLDPSRPVVAAAYTANPQSIQLVPDWQCLNTYPGWYWGESGSLAHEIQKAARSFRQSRIAVSEYGAGGNPAQHGESPIAGKPDAGGSFHPEEYQTRQHEVQYGQIKDNPALWGSFVWAMFDFASDKRNEGGHPGINDKGLVTHDRRIRKDAYFFYKANWNPEPMVRIAASRNTPRKQAKTDVEVFTNAPGGAELLVNGRSLGVAKPDKVNVCRWSDVTLAPGDNQIEAKAMVNGKAVTDRCQWTVIGG
jgi:beta-galactosidase